MNMIVPSELDPNWAAVSVSVVFGLISGGFALWSYLSAGKSEKAARKLDEEANDYRKKTANATERLANAEEAKRAVRFEIQKITSYCGKGEPFEFGYTLHVFNDSEFPITVIELDVHHPLRAELGHFSSTYMGTLRKSLPLKIQPKTIGEVVLILDRGMPTRDYDKVVIRTNTGQSAEYPMPKH